MNDIATKQGASCASLSCAKKDSRQSANADSMPMCAGQHYIVDFWEAKYLNDVDFIAASMQQAASMAGAVLLDIKLHEFQGEGGVTGIALLAESHISIHTWPEYGYAAFDVFMCGNAKPEMAVSYLEDVFSPSRVEINCILRGRRE